MDSPNDYSAEMSMSQAELAKALKAARRENDMRADDTLTLCKEIDALQSKLDQRRWVPITERMPDNGRKVWLHFLSRAGKGRTVFGYYLSRRSREAQGCDFDDDNDALDYDEACNTYYWPAGWYESCDNSEGDFPMETDPTHWMPLPEPPK